MRSRRLEGQGKGFGFLSEKDGKPLEGSEQVRDVVRLTDGSK